MNNSSRRPRDARSRLLEPLESRCLLSVSSPGSANPYAAMTPAATGSFSGYSPAQIKHAYGFDLVTVNGHAADGTGQTIALIDAYRHPNLAADLHTFSQKFNLPDPPSLTIVGQTGGPVSSVSVDSGWASETALDVEWAHAIAPGANLLVIEAKSDDFRDLMAGVDYARKQPGVTVVSMSWGGDEWAGQTAYDKFFTTPAGHAGVTFVASSGDDGGLYGAEWPGTSPNVVSVGGTVLTTADNAGTYGSEIAWNYSTGGASTVEKTPAWQTKANGGKRRTAPDVAYNASVVHGFAAYCSIPDQGDVGWANVGGTSAGAPQWAGLVALANQARAAQGKGSLDGPSTVLPALYSTYSSAGAYAASYHDITSGRIVPRGTAYAGYDTSTGLGTPKAAAVVTTLTTATPVAKAATTTTGSRRGRHARAHVARGDGAGNESGGGVIVTPNTTGNNPGDTGTPAPTAVANVYVVRLSDRAATSDQADKTTSVFAPAEPSNASAGSTEHAAPVYAARLTQLNWFLDGESAADAANRSVFAMSPSHADVADATPHQAAAASPEQFASLAPVAPAPLAVAKAGAVFHFAHIDLGATFADAMSSFVQDSTTLGNAVLPVAGKSRAWTITGAVLAADAIMVGSWYAQYRRTKQQRQAAAALRARRSPFLLGHAVWED